jgi:toxin ParE1/3/4
MDWEGMRYRLNKEAKFDLACIYWRGVEQFGEAQAERYYDALIQQFIHIADNPYSYPAVNTIRTGYRRSVCGVDSIYYRITDDCVDIMRVLGRQDIDASL